MGAWIETWICVSVCDNNIVAPHVGAWIETLDYQNLVEMYGLSLPMWERGLKHLISISRSIRHVAPHVGAWIETTLVVSLLLVLNVAPHVGAWIETYILPPNNPLSLSLPMWERGLKLSL